MWIRFKQVYQTHDFFQISKGLAALIQEDYWKWCNVCTVGKFKGTTIFWWGCIKGLQTPIYICKGCDDANQKIWIKRETNRGMAWVLFDPLWVWAVFVMCFFKCTLKDTLTVKNSVILSWMLYVSPEHLIATPNLFVHIGDQFSLAAPSAGTKHRSRVTGHRSQKIQ